MKTTKMVTKINKAIPIILVICILLVGCGQNHTDVTNNSLNPAETSKPFETEKSLSNTSSSSLTGVENIDFKSLDDEDLQQYVRDTVYTDLIADLNSDDYYVENVSTSYVSQEYIDELEYNSKANIYFGYSLSDLEKQFQGRHFVFTYQNGNTQVEEFKEYDDTYDQVVRNVAIGTGVILICVTVSAVTAGAGAPAVSMIFAASAKTGTTVALSSGVISAAASGIVTGVETGDVKSAVKSAALEGSKGFMWGAIGGAVSGGAGEAVALKGAALNGLTMNEAATIQKESKYSLDVIKKIRSMDEYNVYKNAGLTYKMVNGRPGLITTDIDWTYKSETAGKMLTNLDRVKMGLPPIDSATGKAYELHHIGQSVDSPLAILTEAQHRSGETNKILHDPNIGAGEGVHAKLTTAEWIAQKKEFWKGIYELVK